MKNSAAAKEVLKECIRQGVLYRYYSYWATINGEEWQAKKANEHKNKYYILFDLCLTFGFNHVTEISPEIQRQYDEKQSRDQAHPSYKGEKAAA